MATPTQFPLSELDHRASRTFVCVTVVLLTLSLATLTSRIVFKIKSGLRFTLDDYLIVAGFVLAVVTWTLFMAVIAPCVLSSRSFLTFHEFEQVIELGVLGLAPCICSIACIKVSVACMLLRFQQNARWRMFLYLLIGIIISTSVGFFLFDLLQCIPLAAAWDPTILGAKCVGSNTFRIMSNINSAINIATDIVLSLFPLTFLRQLRRPLLEKVLVGALMAMGMAAASASLTKALLLRIWVTAVDSFAVGFTVSNWTCIEMFLGITAACLPSLKSPVERFLTYLGLDFSSPGPSSFFRSIGEPSAPTRVLQEPLHETNTHIENTPNNNTLYSIDMVNLSKQSTQVGVDTSTSRSDKSGKGSSRSRQFGDIV